jgi:hypothetical protein
VNENASEIQVERSKILQWLDRVDQIDHHDDTISEHATGTGSWFLQREFKEWFEKPSSLLWLYGSGAVFSGFLVTVDTLTKW